MANTSENKWILGLHCLQSVRDSCNWDLFPPEMTQAPEH